jgi:hypothetical protein
MTSNTEDSTTKVISPHKFTPMPGVHNSFEQKSPAVIQLNCDRYA